MGNKIFEERIERIFRDIEKRKTVDYADKNSVRRYNAAMDRIVANVKAINNDYPEQKRAFLDFMYHKDPSIAMTFACMVIHVLSCEVDEKREAIAVVRKLLEDGKLDALQKITVPYNLERWEAQYGTGD